MSRQEFMLTDSELEAIRDASTPVPYLVVCGVGPISPQDTANAAWQRLAAERGFIWDSVQPSSKGERYFTAEVSSPSAEPPKP